MLFRSGCGSGACKWRACFPAFVSGFYCKKQEKIALNLQAHGPRRAKCDRNQMGRKMCVERCILGVSLAREAELKRMLAGYSVETSVKGGRRQPVRLSNKGGKHLTSSGLGVGPLHWRSCGLRYIRPRPCRSCDLYTIRLKCYGGLALI